MHVSGTSPEICLLGPLELRLGDAPVAIARAKQRALLALLATEVGRTVSVDRMVDELWGTSHRRGPLRRSRRMCPTCESCWNRTVPEGLRPQCW